LLAAGRMAKVVCSFPRQTDSYVFDGLYRAGKVLLEVVPQGNLSERIRAAGAARREPGVPQNGPQLRAGDGGVHPRGCSGRTAGRSR
jgi:hypothetical protein